MTIIDNKKIRVLLVEDEPIVMAVHRKILTDIGYTLDTATDGEQALELATTGIGYDIIFMDIGLPNKSGTEIAAEIRQHEGDRKHTYIIALTGYSLEEVNDTCKEAGMDAVLQKPIDAEALQKIVQQTLDQNISNSDINV